MQIDDMFGGTVNVLAKSMDLRVRSHGQISANIANAETPGYIPSTLSFEDELKTAVKSKGKGRGEFTTHPRHIPLKGASSGVLDVQGKVVQGADGAIGLDGNGVEMEKQMGSMMENQMMYNATVQILGKKFEGLKSAIRGDR